uniref:Uncharacterized protein n=1 Tax=Anguilla anguilla TaxID=7936 RepID=A0A0E9VGE2_ANGAN
MITAMLKHCSLDASSDFSLWPYVMHGSGDSYFIECSFPLFSWR